MDRLYMGSMYEREVDELLEQLSDERALNIKSRMTSARGGLGFGCTPSDYGWAHLEKDDSVFDQDLDERFANLKIRKPPRKTEKEGAQRKGLASRKEASSTVGGTKSTTFQPIGNKEDLTRIGRSFAYGSSYAIQEEPDSLLDQNLVARLRALKEVPSPPRRSDFSSQRSENSSCYFSSQDSHDVLPANQSFSSFTSSPSASLLPGSSSSSSRPSGRVLTTSVVTSCHCSAPSPLKLLKQMSVKKKPEAVPKISSSSMKSSDAASHTTPATKDSSETKSSTNSSSKEESYNWKQDADLTTTSSKSFKKSKSLAKSVTKKISQKHKDEELSTSGPNMRRMLSSVADRVGFERSRVSSAEESDIFEGDCCSYSLMDRDIDFTKATLEENRLNHQAERVVEWAKDAARLEVDTSDDESDQLDLGEYDRFSDSSAETRFHKSTPPVSNKTIRKGKRFYIF